MREAVLDFISLLRRNGVRVSVSEAMDALESLRWAPLLPEGPFRDALRTTLVKSQRDLPTYEELFDRHFWGLFKKDWGGGEAPAAGDMQPLEVEGSPDSEAKALDPALLEALEAMGMSDLARALLEQSDEELLVQVAQAAGQFDLSRIESQLQQNFYAYGLAQFMGQGRMGEEIDRMRQGLLDRGFPPNQVDDLEAFLRKRLETLQRLTKRAVGNALGKNQIRYRERFRERSLSEKSFNAMTLEELAEMRHLIYRLAQRLKNIMSLRLRRADGGRLDMPATLRANMKNGGIPFDLRLRKRHKIKPEIVVLCDISDSVRYVSRFMLQLVYNLQEIIAKVRSYVFVSQLGETTELFKQYEVQEAIDRAYAGEVINLYSHSNYGLALETFHELHLSAVGPRTTVMVIGDARNNYFEPKEYVLKEIGRRAKELIWLNPEAEISWGLGDSEMPLYRKYCDKVSECRNLLQLEKIINNLLRL